MSSSRFIVLPLPDHGWAGDAWYDWHEADAKEMWTASHFRQTPPPPYPREPPSGQLYLTPSGSRVERAPKDHDSRSHPRCGTPYESHDAPGSGRQIGKLGPATGAQTIRRRHAVLSNRRERSRVSQSPKAQNVRQQRYYNSKGADARAQANCAYGQRPSWILKSYEHTPAI